ncbi:MAG TPA: S8 family serine peptidase [Acidimicrobiales bacterium]|nr:S8 family serine peptidase [Acidimicrobiales bacterium]
MTKARATIIALAVATIMGGWPAAGHASSASSWVPRGNNQRSHPKIEPAVEQQSTPDDAPVVVRVAGDPTDASAAVSDVGGTVRTESSDAVLAWVRPSQFTTLADDARVQRISEPRRPRPTTTSEGVAAIGAPTWYSAGFDGSGVKLGIVDLGFQQLATEQAAGHLPVTAVTKNFCSGGIGGNTEHGTAVAEIAHQVAPGAQLYLVCIEFDDDVAAAEQYLAQQGVTVVNASFSDPLGGRGDGTGPLGDAVAAGRQAGQLWSVAAGNDADRHFSFTATDLDGDGAVEFDGNGGLTAGPDDRELYGFSLSHNNATVSIGIKWDAWPVTNQEFDLCLWTAGAPLGTFLGCQFGSQELSASEPINSFTASGMSAGSYVLSVSRGEHTVIAPRIDMYFEGDEVGLQRVSSDGSIGEPASSPAAMAVGAHNVSSTNVEGFSSRGPTIDGRAKPDVMAPDGVSNDIFDPFFGTSAAAPHAAGAAALVKQALPGATPAEVQTFLSCRATGGGSDGPENGIGYGSLALGAAPTPALTAATKPAVVAHNFVFERSGLCSGHSDHLMLYGEPSDVVLLCDWDGNGTRTPGAFRNGAWYLRNAPGPGAADVPVFTYGDPGDIPVCGHWGGPGKAETAGVFRNGVFFLRDSNTTGVADRPPVGYGNPGDIPAVGDWDGNGTTTLGVFRRGVWFLRNSNSTGVADQPPVGYGDPTDLPVPGDWDGNGTTTLGVYRDGYWFLRNSIGGGVADLPPFHYGGPGTVPGAWR